MSPIDRDDVAEKADLRAAMIKVVYFDEESASDYLDISAGGKSAATSENVKDRTTKLHGEVETRLAAKFSWLPFLGGSAEAAGGVDISRAGQSILRKTLSNTILTDYLAKAGEDSRVKRLRHLRVTAPKDSMAYMKMFTPYMVMLKMDDIPFDLARMDDTLAGTKGYYELLGEGADGSERVLRFNIRHSGTTTASPTSAGCVSCSMVSSSGRLRNMLSVWRPRCPAVLAKRRLRQLNSSMVGPLRTRNFWTCTT